MSGSGKNRTRNPGTTDILCSAKQKTSPVASFQKPVLLLVRGCPNNTHPNVKTVWWTLDE